MKTTLLVLAAALAATFSGRPAEAIVSYGDNYIRSLCVYKLSQTKFFSDPENQITVARKFKPGYGVLREAQYTLRPDGIFESLQTQDLIWTTKDFVERRNTTGKIEVDTQQAQILLIAKAFEVLDRTRLTPEQSADLYKALFECRRVNAAGPIEPDRPHSLYTQDTMNLGTRAADFILNFGESRAATTGGTNPKQ